MFICLLLIRVAAFYCFTFPSQNSFGRFLRQLLKATAQTLKARAAVALTRPLRLPELRREARTTDAALRDVAPFR